MCDFKPKLSPVTGKWIEFGIFEVLGHLEFNVVYFVTVENVHAVAIRNYSGIGGWIKDKELKEMIQELKQKDIRILLCILSQFVRLS